MNIEQRNNHQFNDICCVNDIIGVIMNTKNNKRKKESVKKIQDAFLKLIQTKELKEISVSEICEITKLNRSTFYANFIDIYDLADRIKHNLELEVKNILTESFSLQKNSLNLFRHIKDNQVLYKTFFKLNYDASYKNINFYDITLANFYFNDNNIEYHIEFFKGGFNALVKKWLDEGCIKSPEEINEILISEYQGRQNLDIKE